jgi:hypothetical protein
LVQFDQLTTNKEYDDVEQLNKDADVLQFSENRAINNIRSEDVSSAPVPTKK